MKKSLGRQQDRRSSRDCNISSNSQESKQPGAAYSVNLASPPSLRSSPFASCMIRFLVSALPVFLDMFSTGTLCCREFSSCFRGLRFPDLSCGLNGRRFGLQNFLGNARPTMFGADRFLFCKSISRASTPFSKRVIVHEPSGHLAEERRDGRWKMYADSTRAFKNRPVFNHIDVKNIVES